MEIGLTSAVLEFPSSEYINRETRQVLLDSRIKKKIPSRIERGFILTVSPGMAGGSEGERVAEFQAPSLIDGKRNR